MYYAILVLAIIFLLVVGTEYLWRHKKLSTEYSRKFVHISVASFVAFWPLFMSWRVIEAISIALLIVILLSKKLAIFKSIHSVNRTTWGETLFAISIVILSFLVHTKWIYAAALLHLGLADGLAAVVGLKINRLDYKVFGHKKSVPGSLTFLVTSVIILSFVGIWWGQASWTILLWLPLLSTIIENTAIYGTDDIFIPIIVAAALGWR